MSKTAAIENEPNDASMSPDEYIRSLSPSQRDDTEFLLTEVVRLTNLNNPVVKRVFVRLKNLNKKDTKVLERIDAAQMQWELRSTPSDMTIIDKSNHKSGGLPEQLSTTASVKNDVMLKFIGDIKRILNAHGYKLLVLAPALLVFLYLSLLSSPRYESASALMVKQPDAGSTLSPELAFLSSMSGGGATNDNELVKAYIYSNDMLQYLEENFSFSQHFSSNDYDVLSRLQDKASLEKKINYFAERVSAEVDATSGIISVSVQAYSPEYAQVLARAIASRAEWYINQVGRDLAKAQLSFVQTEHDRVEEKLQEAQNRLLAFQRQYNLIDPEAELAALQQITFGLEGQIAAKKAELNALRGSMSESAPAVVQVSEQLSSLETQLKEERGRLTSSSGDNASETDVPAVNHILNQFTDYKIDLEFALQSYSASKISLEKSRIEAYRQLKYLVVVDAAFLPEDNTYPKVFYSTFLVFILLTLLFGIAKLIIATVDELK
ncbi:lipopolysaccharide biosynthesis protein [Agaribacter marinus]|uniref:Capsular polysaccharide transport system permease protein n=1 Tax=Agaribacter marinus TaxID=1431249 RepID=A0AA37SZM9_9ALTE|nr:lipopolysaccharide biosynthesis protein [Agaribacter marinus]GLR70886.1 hypothetical protein GCM10007852_17940 [Agaribacter marinus]